MRYLIFFLFALAFVSCENAKKPLNKFDDPLFGKIADLQDRRSADSLARYLSDPNEGYREASALAFASIQDSLYVDKIETLILNDADTDVRIAAAYALGQTVSAKSESVLIQAAHGEKDPAVLAQLIESYGKVCKRWQLDLTFEDSVLTTALAWAHYRVAVRGSSDEALNKNSSQFIKSPYKTTRLAAAHYFSRGAKDFEAFQSVIISTALHDSSPDVRMAAVLALRKVKSDSSRLAAENAITNDADYRVRVNAVRALQVHPFDQTKKILLQALNDPETNVGIAASETIKGVLSPAHWREVRDVAQAHPNWRIQADLFEAALSVSGDKALAQEVQSAFDRSENPYQKAALLTALQHSVTAHVFLKEQLLKGHAPVVKVSAALALVGMNSNKNFDPALKSEFASIYEDAISDGDPAVIGIVAGALTDSTLGYKSLIKDFGFLVKARSKLSLPKDFESIVPLEAAIAYFEGREPPSSLTNTFNHPIPWPIVKKVPRDQKATIKTSRGDIVIRLFVDEAPGSVANFVNLASSRYYDGKFFHRVVPNFVVQAGCPRGDGWGSEDYSIRSEFSPRRYKTGSIGMASAGKDTEGTQWFITHSATPHLEGRYTLFGEVIQGMDVVHQITVGDSIVSIEIIN